MDGVDANVGKAKTLNRELIYRPKGSIQRDSTKPMWDSKHPIMAPIRHPSFSIFTNLSRMDR